MATATDLAIYDDAQRDGIGKDGTDLNPMNRDHAALIERHLIACCLWDDTGLDDAMELVAADDFVTVPHPFVFRTCAELRATSRPVSAATVYDIAVRSGHGLDMGPNGAAWLARTLELEPTGFRARYYATLVREISTRRRLFWASQRIADMALNPTGPVAEILGQCEQCLFDLGDAAGPVKSALKSAQKVINDALIRMDQRQERGRCLDGLSTGYSDLDSYLGGLRPGQLTVLGARPSKGKTALGLNVAVNVAEAGVPVLMFSLEMPESEIGDRMLAMRSGVSMHRLTKGDRLSRRESEAVAEAALGDGSSGLSSRPLYVDDTPDQPATRIFAVARRAVRKLGVRLIVVDYLQLLRAENHRENRVNQVGMMANRLRQIARECNVPVLALCQLSRGVENRNDKPRLADLRESGEIEQHAHAVALIHWHDATPQEGQEVCMVDLVVAKNRNGPTGEVTLAYRRPVMRFESAVPGY